MPAHTSGSSSSTSFIGTAVSATSSIGVEGGTRSVTTLAVSVNGTGTSVSGIRSGGKSTDV